MHQALIIIRLRKNKLILQFSLPLIHHVLHSFFLQFNGSIKFGVMTESHTKAKYFICIKKLSESISPALKRNVIFHKTKLFEQQVSTHSSV